MKETNTRMEKKKTKRETKEEKTKEWRAISSAIIEEKKAKHNKGILAGKN